MAINSLKDPPTWLKVATTLEKPPTPTHIGPWNIGSNFESIVLELIMQKHRRLGRWIPENFTNEKSTLVQLMTWCRQAPSHYLGHVDPDLCCHMASPGHNKLNGVSCWYFSSETTKTWQTCTVNLMAADDLAPQDPGSHINIKTLSNQYSDSHYKDHEHLSIIMGIPTVKPLV